MLFIVCRVLLYFIDYYYYYFFYQGLLLMIFWFLFGDFFNCFIFTFAAVQGGKENKMKYVIIRLKEYGKIRSSIYLEPRRLLQSFNVIKIYEKTAFFPNLFTTNPLNPTNPLIQLNPQDTTFKMWGRNAGTA